MSTTKAPPSPLAVVDRFREFVIQHPRATVAACGLMLFGPLLYCHFTQMLAKPHYQFVALMPLVLLLLWQRALQLEDRDFPARAGKTVWVQLGFALSLAALTLSVYLWSPTLSIAAALLCSLTLCYCFLGSNGTLRFLPLWITAASTIPLPFSMDEDLIVRLREVTTALTSNVLDEFGVLHHQYGTLIELPTRQLFIADACSGIHSLFVLITCSLVIAAWNRRSVFHSALLLIAALGLVLIENVARLTIITVLITQIDLSSGLRHSILGGILFVCSVLFLCSADQWLRFILPKGEGMWFGRQTERKVATPGAAPRSRPVNWNLLLLVAGAAPLFLVAELWQWSHHFIPLSTLFPPTIDLRTFGEEELPGELRDFERTGYEIITRSEGDPLGRNSQRWQFARGVTKVAISVDYPYEGVHDLTVCFRQIGWEVQDKQVIPAAELPIAGHGDAAVARLSRPNYGHGYLISSLLDFRGQPVAVIKDLARGTAQSRVATRVGTTANPDKKPAQASLLPTPPFVQFQLFALAPSRLSDAEATELLKLFVDARERLEQAVKTNVDLKSK